MNTTWVLFVLRRIVLTTILVLPQWFWLGRGWRLMARIRWPWLRICGRIFIASVAVAIVSVLSDRILRKFLPDPFSILIAPITQLWVFASTFAFFCVKAVHAVEWVWSKLKNILTTAGQLEATDPGRRSFFRFAAALVGTLPFVGAVYGFTRERLRFEIVRVTIHFPNLHPQLNGLRIAQLSDIHVGDFMPVSEVRRAVVMANSLAPSLTVVTGDFLTSWGDPLNECIEALSHLSAPLGVWGCNGNHEIYAGAEDEAEELFRKHGMTLLRQRAVELDWKGASLNMIGIDYQHNIQLTGATQPALASVEPFVRKEMLNILLSHNPNAFYRAAELGIELTLAGHTHGGQVSVAVGSHSWSPAKLMTEFLAGLYELPIAQTTESDGGAGKDRAFLYVNRGLGTLEFPLALVRRRRLRF